MMTPCNGCYNRNIECHGKCEEYNQFKGFVAEVRNAKYMHYQEQAFFNYVNSNACGKIPERRMCRV